MVAVAELELEPKLELSDLCHKQGIKFVMAETRGVFASVFCDFGEEHVVTDSNGEPCK